MNELLKEELLENEKVLWEGKAETFSTLDKTHKLPMIKRAALIIGVVAAICIWYVVYSMANSIVIKPAIIVTAMFCAFLGAFSFISQANKIKKMRYYATNQRIICCVEIPKFLEYGKISDVVLKQDADGHTSVLFGKNAIKAKAHQWRSLSLLDPYLDEETGFCTRFAMYAVDDAEQLKKVLSEYIPL